MIQQVQIEPTRWTNRKLWRAIAVVFVIQLGLIYLLAGRPGISQPSPNETMSFQFLINTAPEQELLDARCISDPRLFVMPSTEGFSGPAWLKIKKAAYAAPNWNEPVKWLNVKVAMLGQWFSDYTGTNGSGYLHTSARWFVESEGSSGIASPLAREHQSKMRIEGDLTKRSLISPVELPQFRSEPLASSVIQVAVDGAGKVVLAKRLSTPSSLPIADQKALQLARAAKFQPINAGPDSTNLTWGKWIFDWHTIPTLETNLSDAVKTQNSENGLR